MNWSPAELDGKLLGGGVTDTFTQEYNNPSTLPGPLPFGGTVGTIKFRVVIQDKYEEDYPSGEDTINSRDGFSDQATIHGDVLEVTQSSGYLTPTGQSEADDTAASLSIPMGVLTKIIYAYNGTIAADPNAGYSSLNVRPGDTLTYRLRYTLPDGDVDNFALKDYLPSCPSSARRRTDDLRGHGFGDGPPTAGTTRFGPTDTFRTLSGITPTISINMANGNDTVIVHLRHA